jgi:lactate dehydrogenase-like 2-hydroxyacid dehydrogenase
MPKPKVIVTRRWPAEVEARLAEAFDAKLNKDDKPFTADELKAALGQCDALMPTVTDKLTAEVLAAEPLKAKMLGSYGVGFNHIDVKAAKARGLVVSNTPDVLTDCTADIAMTLLLTVARRTGEGERHVRASQWAGWRPTHMVGTKVAGKTIGIVGMGRIGRAMAKRAHGGFGMKVIYHDVARLKPEQEHVLGARPAATLEELLGAADFVSLHCPALPETRHLMNAQRLAQMQKHAFLINTARGDVVDEAALVAALEKGTIAGAGLDVFEAEPKVTPALLAMENVVVLPHLGSATRETRLAMGLRVIDNVSAFFAGKEPPDRVA